MFQLVAQIIGIIAMIINIFSFQFKNKKHLIFVLGVGSFLFAVSFIILGDFASAGFNIVNIFRSVTVINRKTHNKTFFICNCLMYFVAAILTYQSPWTFILMSSQLVSTYVHWYRDAVFVRKAQMFYISPVWLANDIFVTFSVGGIICEAFSILSVLVSFIRYGKSGFDNADMV